MFFLAGQLVLNQYALGVTSGVKGQWTVNTASNCLEYATVAGQAPMLGGMALCVAAEGGNSFSWSATPASGTAQANISTTVSVPASSSATLLIRCIYRAGWGGGGGGWEKRLFK